MDVTGEQPTQAEWPAMYGGLAQVAPKDEPLSQAEVLSLMAAEAKFLVDMLSTARSTSWPRTGVDVKRQVKVLQIRAAQIHDTTPVGK